MTEVEREKRETRVMIREIQRKTRENPPRSLAEARDLINQVDQLSRKLDKLET